MLYSMVWFWLLLTENNFLYKLLVWSRSKSGSEFLIWIRIRQNISELENPDSQIGFKY